MPKKSRQVAARYAQKSRTKKTAHRPNILTGYPDTDEADDALVVDDGERNEDRINYSRYGYVVSDLRNMGMLIGGLAVILIILTIVLR